MRRRYYKREAPPKPKPFPWYAVREEGAYCPVDLRKQKTEIASGEYSATHGCALEYAYMGSDDAVYVGIATLYGWEYWPARKVEE